MHLTRTVNADWLVAHLSDLAHGWRQEETTARWKGDSALCKEARRAAIVVEGIARDLEQELDARARVVA